MRCTLCPRFSAAPLCQRCTTHVEHATHQILAAIAGPLALHLQQHAEAEERAATLAAQAAAAAPLPDAPTTGDLAVSGEQGDQAHDLLDNATARGQRLLQQITRAALTRALKSGPKSLRGARSLYSKAEREALSSGLASILAPATLLGRSRIREQMDPTQFADWTRFDGTLQPMAPEKALAYFQSLTPSLTDDPKRFGTDQRRKAFTLAVATEKGLLDRVKGVLAGGLQSGESTTSLTVQVQDLLDSAGVSSRNPQYAALIVRTNLNDAYNTGQMEEMQDPDVKDFFPVWRYDGIEDGRERPSHRKHFGKYYPNNVAFAKVRDEATGGKFSGYNCRCTATPVNQFDWDDLQAQGARIEPGYGSVEKPKAVTQTKAKSKPAPPPVAPRKPLDQLTPADVQGMTRKELLAVAQEYGLQPGKRTTETLRQRIATDIEMGIAKPATATPEPTPTPQQPAVNAIAAVLDATQRLAGSNNRVTIADLQAATGLDLATLHDAINALRRQGVLSGSGIEGRASVDDRTLAAAIRGPDGEVIGSVSLRPRR